MNRHIILFSAVLVLLIAQLPAMAVDVSLFDQTGVADIAVVRPIDPGPPLPADAEPVPEIAKKPIMLEQALQIAFEYSPDIRIALDKLEKARGGRDESRARFNPTFSLGATTSIQGPVTVVNIGGNDVELSTPNSTVGTASLLLPLDISKQLTYASDIAELQFQMEYLSMVSTSETLIYNVKSAFFDLLRACGWLDVSKKAVDVSQRRLDDAQARYEAGAAPKFDVTVAQVDLANLKQDLLTAQSNVHIAQAAFNRVLGINVNNPTQVIGFLPMPSLPGIDAQKSIEEAYGKRPEIKMAELGVKLSEKNVALQQSGLKPTLAVVAGANYNLNTTPFNPNDLTWSAALNLSIPVWDGGLTSAKVRSAKADAQTSADSLKQAKLGISQEVKTVILSLEDAAARAETTTQTVLLAEEAMRQTNIRYEAGIAVPVEVTNSVSQLTQARFYFVNAQFDYAMALARLEKATSAQPELAKLQLLTDSGGNN